MPTHNLVGSICFPPKRSFQDLRLRRSCRAHPRRRPSSCTPRTTLQFPATRRHFLPRGLFLTHMRAPLPFKNHRTTFRTASVLPPSASAPSRPQTTRFHVAGIASLHQRISSPTSSASPHTYNLREHARKVRSGGGGTWACETYSLSVGSTGETSGTLREPS